MHEYATDAGGRRTAPLVVAALSVLVAFVFYKVSGHYGWTPPWWLDVPTPLATFGVLMGIYDRSAWRWRIGPLRLSAVPDYNGTWQGTVTSDFNPEKSIPATLVIRQTWSRVSVELRGEHSSSRSTMASIMTEDAAEPGLRYEYRSDPRNLAPDGMNAHRGVAHLRLDAAGQLDGDYYSGRSRKTTGRMSFRKGAVIQSLSPDGGASAAAAPVA